MTQEVTGFLFLFFSQVTNCDNIQKAIELLVGMCVQTDRLTESATSVEREREREKLIGSLLLVITTALPQLQLNRLFNQHLLRLLLGMGDDCQARV